MKTKNEIIGCIVTLVLVLFLLCSTGIASADTEIKASTSTNLSASGAGTTILRLIPIYEVKPPDLWFEANAEATTVINNSGSATIKEGYAAMASTNGPTVVAGGAVTSFYSATNVREIKVNLSSEVEVKRGKNVLHTYVSGISLASPDADYELGLSGSHEVTTDAVAGGVDFDVEEQLKRLRFSFEAYPRVMDPVADVVNETIGVNYNIGRESVKSYGFDFSSEIEANDITCTSSMSYKKGGA